MNTNLVTDIELLDLENKLRAMISELVTQVVHKSAEHEVLIKKALNKARKNKKNLFTIDNELKKKISRLVPTEEFNKRYESWYTLTNNRFDSNEYNFEQHKLRFEENLHETSDLKSKLKVIEEKLKKINSGIEDNYRYMREFQDILSHGNSKALMELRVFINQQQVKNDEASEKINKLSLRINDINAKALPEVVCMIEKRNFELEEIKIKVRDAFVERVLKKDVVMLGNKLEGEIFKLNEVFEKEVEDIKGFLDKVLRVEINCGVSDTLLKILDSRATKKLIPLVETQLQDEPRLCASNSKIFIKTLYSKAQDQMRILAAKLTNTKVKDDEKKVPEKKVTEMKVTERKVPKLKNPKSFIKQEESSPIIRAVYTEVKSAVLEPDPVIEQPLEAVESIEERQDDIKISLISERSNPQASKDSERLEIVPHNHYNNSSISFEPSYGQDQIDKILLDLNNINSELQKIQNRSNDEIVDLETVVYNFQKELKMSIEVLGEEYSQLNKQRVKEVGEIHYKISEIQENFEEKTRALAEIEGKVTQNVEVAGKCFEAVKVIQALMMQDEEDRQSLQLSCYVENRGKAKLPSKQKNVVTLRPECLSCTSQSSVVYSAFKMACLNYLPSEVKFNSRSFSRKELISKMLDPEQGHSEYNKGFLTQDSIKLTLNAEESISRAKSATRVKIERRILDASFNKSFFSNESPPKRISMKTHKLNYN